MKKIIVIPTTDGLLSSHFGHCEKFYFAVTENGKVTDEYYKIPPEHEPGLYPKWVKEQGGSLVIAGGMGQKAQTLFSNNGVDFIVGAPAIDPRKVVDQFLSNSLETSENTCDH